MSDEWCKKSELIDGLKKAIESTYSIDFEPSNVGIICSNEYIYAGQLVADYVNECSMVPTTVTNDVRIPGWFNKESLVIILVVHNKSEQMKEVIQKLKKTHCKTVVISDFEAKHIDDSVDNIIITRGHKYRCFGEMIGHLLTIFDSAKIIDKANVLDDLAHIESLYDEHIERVKKIDFHGYTDKRVIISYPPNLRSTAGIWKSTITRRMKMSVFHTEYPEFNHNEIVGWCMSPDLSDRFVNIFLCDNNTNKLLSVISKSEMEVLSDNGSRIIEMPIDGGNNFSKNILGFIMGESIPRTQEEK